MVFLSTTKSTKKTINILQLKIVACIIRMVTMSRHQKIADKIQKKPTPSNVTWDELCYYLKQFGYQRKPGSNGFKFRKPGGAIINAHKPHPGNEVKEYLIEQILEKLMMCGDLDHE